MKLILIAIFLSVCDAASREIACESFKNGSWTFEGREHICYMTVATSINSNDFKILSSGNESIKALTFFENRKIQYLPVDIYKSFPNLTEILGHSCSIRSLYKDNFRNLWMLKELWLIDNQIERINSDTFEDLTALEWLDLSRNNIKWMNGRLFSGLNSLIEVSLTGNECINRNFLEPIQAATLAKVISEKCGFCKTDNLIEAMICERTFHSEQNAEKRILDILDGQSRQIEMLETLVNRTLDEKEKCQSELELTVGSITRLEGQVESANSQIVLFNKLDASRNQNFIERMEDLREDLAIKERENAKLLSEVRKLKADGAAMEREVKELKRIALRGGETVTGSVRNEEEDEDSQDP